MKTHVKWLASGVTIIAIIAYGIYTFFKPLEVEIFEVTRQTAVQSFEEEGIVEAAEERPIYSIINGKIETLAITEGQTVQKGDLLLRIEAKELEYELGQLQAQLESIEGQKLQAHKNPYSAQITLQQLIIEETKRQLQLAKQDLERATALYESGAVSKKEWEDYESKVKNLENNVKQQEQAMQLIEEQAEPLPGTDQYFTGLQKSVEEQIKQIEYLLDNTNITAPINGVVQEVNVEEGTMITSQMPLLTLISPHAFEVEVYLLTEDVLHVKEGMSVTLVQNRKDEDYMFDGVVKAIAPSAVEKISSLGLSEQRVKVTIAPNEQEMPDLRVGYALDVQFTTLKQENVIVVPKKALFPFGEENAVWVVKNGKIQPQKVKTGMETDEHVVIENGLQEGDLILQNPQLEGVEEGKRVTYEN